ncbi:MAG: transcriptional regulator [Comamonas sp.]|nr:transcriptional regulator [Comamonas sp.]
MYHYTECGLKNVWLKDGYRTIDTPYGKATSIDDVESLHKAIATSLIEKKGQLDGAELRFLRTTAKLTQKTLAELLSTSEQSISLWERNNGITATADMMVRLLCAEKLGLQPKATLISEVTRMVKSLQEKIIAKEKNHKWNSLITEQDLAIA